jgi:hypothetical protein
MMGLMVHGSGYDWVDDDDLSLAETDRRFEALGPVATDVPDEVTTDHGRFVVVATHGAISIAAVHATHYRRPDGSVTDVAEPPVVHATGLTASVA